MSGPVTEALSEPRPNGSDRHWMIRFAVVDTLEPGLVINCDVCSGVILELSFREAEYGWACDRTHFDELIDGHIAARHQ